MKTKLSKRLLSVLLAALMVVTSVPLMAFNVFADSETDANVDPNVQAAQTAMDGFEALLSESGKAYKNVEPAYNAYVGVQKAMDAYVYGTASASSLNDAVAALTTAQSQIEEFTGYTGNAVPTFEHSTVDDMAGYAGTGYNNVLYTVPATEIASSTDNDGIRLGVTYSNDTVLLYDGINDAKMPVMMSGILTAKKQRYIYSAFPTSTKNTGGSETDHEYLQLVDYWHSGAHVTGGKTSSNVTYDPSNVYGDNANWNWNWWYTTANSDGYTPAYNVATGSKLSSSTDHRSAQLAYYKKWTAGDWYAFSSGISNYSSNVLKVVKEPAAYGDVYYPYWYFCTGNDASDETVLEALGAVSVVNYKTLTDAIATNGEKMKSIDLAEFSEGGLLAYIQAMDTATAFDPNTYFTNGNGYTQCVADMKIVVRGMNTASVYEYDSDEYVNLREAMDAKMAAYNKGVNPGYNNYDEFLVLWNEAQDIMDAVVEGGYADYNAAQNAADKLNSFVLEVDFDPVNTAALENVIDATKHYANIFTAETYNALDAMMDEAITAVWGAVDKYKDTASALALSDENQAIVDGYVTAVNDAVKALRIDPAAVVQTEYGRYSLDNALALANNIEDPSDYWNYGYFKTALDSASEYKDLLPSTDLTNYTKQHDEYIIKIEDLVYAYNALEFTFRKTPDGTIARVGTRQAITTLTDQKNSNGYNWNIDFEYPSNDILVLKTNHDATTINYGTADVSFAINHTNNSSKENNALDSITISGTSNENTSITSNAASSSPDPLNDEQKNTTYAGSLSQTVNNSDGTTSTFSLSNFRVTGETNNAKSYYGTDANGNAVTGRESATDEYTKILATTEGSDSNPARGTIALQMKDGNSGWARITLTADMNVSVPGSEAKELSADTLPVLKTYTLSDTYFGATYVWNTQPTLAYAGYAYLTSKTNDEPIYSVVQVLDVSYLFDLIDKCNALMAESERYTESSWSNFTYYLAEASKDFGYTNQTLNATALSTRAQTRYTNLWNAYQALEIKTVPVTFSYKNALGNDVTKVINVTYEDTLNSYLDEFNSINLVNYTSADGLYTYTPNGTWTPDIDLNAPVKHAATYTANYDEKINMADFTEYENAVNALLAKLTDETYSVAALNTLADEIDTLTYYTLTPEEKAEYNGTYQGSINAETAEINALADALAPSALDLSTAKAAAAEAKLSKDKDVYDITGLEFTYTQTVSVGGVEVVGLVYATQDEIDAAIADVLNNLNKCSYTVYFNGTPVGTVEYGTPVIVNSNGQFVANVSDMGSAAYDGDTMVAWKYSYEAPSREDKGATTPKYMLTAKSLGFVVKGDTYLTTAKAEEDEAGYVVKFATNDGKVFDVQYTTDGTVTVPAAPTYAFYKFTGYDNGAVAGDVINVTENTTITANYDADKTKAYTIHYFNSVWDSWQWFDASVAEEITANYEELVRLSNPDAYCWAVATYDADTSVSTYRVVAYGTEYAFNACESFDYNNDYKGLVAVTYDEYEAIIFDSTDDSTGEFIEDATDYIVDGSGNPVLANVSVFGDKEIPEETPSASVSENVIPVYDDNGKFSKFTMIGSCVLPEGYTAVESGILFSSNQSADLVIERVGTDGIARFKPSRVTSGNQFAINVKAPSNGNAVSFKYAAYVIVKDAEGNLTTVYSKSVLGSTQGFLEV